MTREKIVKYMSLQDAIQVLRDTNAFGTMDIAKSVILKALEHEPKKGHWFVDERPESNREIICSNCEQPIFKYYKLDFDYRPKYCPNCGAKMVELKESAEPHECNTCKFGSYYKNGYDVTTMDDECGGCCEWNDKWQPKEESEDEK